MTIAIATRIVNSAIARRKALSSIVYEPVMAQSPAMWGEIARIQDQLSMERPDRGMVHTCQLSGHRGDLPSDQGMLDRREVLTRQGLIDGIGILISDTNQPKPLTAHWDCEPCRCDMPCLFVAPLCRGSGTFLFSWIESPGSVWTPRFRKPPPTRCSSISATSLAFSLPPWIINTFFFCALIEDTTPARARP